MSPERIEIMKYTWVLRSLFVVALTLGLQACGDDDEVNEVPDASDVTDASDPSDDTTTDDPSDTSDASDTSDPSDVTTDDPSDPTPNRPVKAPAPSTSSVRRAASK